VTLLSLSHQSNFNKYFSYFLDTSIFFYISIKQRSNKKFHGIYEFSSVIVGIKLHYYETSLIIIIISVKYMLDNTIIAVECNAVIIIPHQ